MPAFTRQIKPLLQALIAEQRSVLLLGPRQTGKTTLLKDLPSDLWINLLDPETRQTYEKNPGTLKKELAALSQRPLVIIDEIQKVPALLDVAQDCIDSKLAYFILTGSSARKLRHHHVNLLPGRVINLYLDPLSLNEYPKQDLMEALLDGSLPGIAGEQNMDLRELDLRSYVTTYLEEEIRAEALVRNIPAFARFIELAASESGQTIQLTKLSKDIGVSHNTIRDYYQILEDTLVAERVDPFISSKTRRQIVKASRYFFFDMGVRRLAAREGKELSQTHFGHLFEQWVGLTLLRAIRNLPEKPTLSFWRDKDGIEVDYVLKIRGEILPIEVKWSQTLHDSDIKHLKIFMKEFGLSKGYVIARIPRTMKLTETITALPWQNILETVN